MKKIKSNSVIGGLPAEAREVVDEMLLSGSGYREVQEFLDREGFPISQTSISQYYRGHIMLVRARKICVSARKLAAVRVEGIDEATTKSLQAVVLDLLANPSPDVESIKGLMGLLLKRQGLENEGRRVKLLEEKAARLAAVEAVLERKDVREGISAAVMAEIESKIKLL